MTDSLANHQFIEDLTSMLNNLKQMEINNKSPAVGHPGVFFAGGNKNRKFIKNNKMSKR